MSPPPASPPPLHSATRYSWEGRWDFTHLHIHLESVLIHIHMYSVKRLMGDNLIFWQDPLSSLRPDSLFNTSSQTLTLSCHPSSITHHHIHWLLLSFLLRRRSKQQDRLGGVLPLFQVAKNREFNVVKTIFCLLTPSKQLVAPPSPDDAKILFFHKTWS